MARQFKDKAGTHAKSTRRSLVAAWHKHLKGPGDYVSLKSFARSFDGDLTIVNTWLNNKRLNVSGVQRKIGRTRKRVKSGGSVKKVDTGSKK